MEAIFHEQQDGSLCAQHCLNSLLQGQFYSAVDLADMATELDTMEKLRMAEMGEDTPEYRQFMQVCICIRHQKLCLVFHLCSNPLQTWTTLASFQSKSSQRLSPSGAWIFYP